MLVTLDFETYYDKDYTLKKLSTSEYVRHPKFAVLSCSVKIDDGETRFYLGRDAVKAALDAIPWRMAELLAHHVHFDGLILSHHFGHVPGAYRCTLSLARALFPKTESNELKDVAARLGLQTQKLEMPDIKGKVVLTAEEEAALKAYNNADVDSCYEAYGAMAEGFPVDELHLISVTARMFADPVLRLDEARVRAELDRERKEKAAAVHLAIPGCASLETKMTVLSSASKTAELLESLGAPPPLKPSPTNPSRVIPALAKSDVEFVNMARHPDPRVAAVVRGRLAAKSRIGETRAERLLTAGAGGMSVPVYLNYCMAHTTRWSGGDKLNFQNFPRGGELRASLLAPPGFRLVVVDSAQIEARVLAWLAGEQWLLEAFRSGADPYCLFGSKVFGREITKADKEERHISKICVLGLGYSMGAWKLHQTLLSGAMGPAVDVPLSACEQFVSIYRRENRNIVRLWDRMGNVPADMSLDRPGRLGPLLWAKDAIRLPNGLLLHYPDTRVTIEKAWMGAFAPEQFSERVMDASYRVREGRAKLYGGLLVENVVQALARTVVAWQMSRIAVIWRVVMMTHDEVVFLVPESDADAALKYALDVMKTPPPWAVDLPLSAEGGHDVNYSK